MRLADPAQEDGELDVLLRFKETGDWCCTVDLILAEDGIYIVVG